MPSPIRVTEGLPLGTGEPLVFIAGPCVIESEEHCLRMAETLRTRAESVGARLVFKASFDKANRSAVDAYRGPGLEEGLRVLERVKRAAGLPVLTDIHEPAQAAPVAEVVDLLQIPAFLCRQTDLVLAAVGTGRAVNIKKGQFVSPWEVKNVLGKTERAGNPDVCITERGASFGYHNLVVDMRSIPIIQGFGAPVVYDVTHSLQLPGGAGTRSGGQPEFALPLARAGVAAGADAVFTEVHHDPPRALSDGANSITPDAWETLAAACIRIRRLLLETGAGPGSESRRG